MNLKRLGLVGILVLTVLWVIFTAVRLDPSPDPTAEDDIAERAGGTLDNEPVEAVDVPRNIGLASENSAGRSTPTDVSDCEWIAILPDFPELAASNCHHLGRAAAAFAQEDEDPVWALSTEDSIRALISNADLSEFLRMEIDCRLTSCGIVLIWPPDTSPIDPVARQLNLASSRLGNEVVDRQSFSGKSGFSGVPMRDGRRVSAIYFVQAENRDEYAQNSPSGPISILPTPSSGQALPSFPGIDVSFPPMGGPNSMNHGERLAAESDDPSWARQMESQIYAAFSQTVELPISQLQVECRTSRCGLAFVSSEGSGTEDMKPFHDHLESQFALRYVGMGFGGIGGQLTRAEYFRQEGRVEAE